MGTAIRNRFAQLLDVPAGNGIWSRVGGVLGWTDPAAFETPSGAQAKASAAQAAAQAASDPAGTATAAVAAEATARANADALKVSLTAIDTDGTLAAASDTRVPSQKAVKTAIANSGSNPSVTVRASGDATGAADPINLQAAIDALKGIGGTVGIENKRYFLGAGITTYPGIGIVGPGPLSDNFSLAARLEAVALNAPIITIKMDAANPTWDAFGCLRDFTIIGTGTTGARTSQHGIVLDDSAGLVLDTKISNVLVFSTGGDGFRQTASACKTFINSCYFEHCVGNGMSLGGGGTFWLFDQYIYDAHAWGIDCKPGGSSASKVELLHNRIWLNPSGGVNVGTGINFIKMTANDFNGNGGVGVPQIAIVGGGLPFQILGNSFKDPRGGSAVTNHITGRSNAGVIEGNSFANSTGKAILPTANSANQWQIRSNPGFNPYGQITNPLDGSATGISCGLTGNTATPVASTDYVIREVDQFVSISGGSGLSISIKDPAGNVIQSGLATLAGQYLPIGFKFNCGAFTGTPTVSAWAN